MSNESKKERKTLPEPDEGDPTLEIIIKNWRSLNVETRDWLFYIAWRASIKRRERLIPTPRWYDIHCRIESR